jgi:hypothetical protein
VVFARVLAGHLDPIPCPHRMATMDGRNPRYVETRIKRLKREISEIDEFFYSGHRSGTRRDLFAGMVERKRDDMVRAAVLQLHAAID